MADFVLIAFVFLQFIPRHSSVPTTTTAGRVVTTSSRTSWNSFSLLHLSPAGQPMCSINSPARTISLNRTSYQIAPTSKCVPGNLLCGWECNRQPGCVGYNFKGSYTGKEICDLYTTKQMNFLPLANCSYYQIKLKSSQNTTDICQTPGFGVDPSQCCSFPFSYNFVVYNYCINVTNSGLTGYGCYLSNRVWAKCGQPINFVAGNRTNNILIPTFPNPTIVNTVNGWIVFQQRVDGSVSFDLPWVSYKNGFGVYSGNFWMGLEKIYQLTTSGQFKLRIEIQRSDNGQWLSHEYDTFIIDAEYWNYTIHVSGYSGDNCDVMNSPTGSQVHNGMQFTTNDRKNDKNNNIVGGVPVNCAQKWFGGWWYNNCDYFNVNGAPGTSGMEVYVNSLSTWVNVKASRLLMKFVA